MQVRKNFGLDSPITIAAIGIVAYVFAVFLHQIIGHCFACIISGSTIKLLTSVHFECEPNSNLVNIAGPAANLLAGVFLFLLSNFKKSLTIHARFFFLLGIAFNLFWGSGSLVISGITGSGDWSYAINSLQPVWMWRMVLLASGIILYLISAKIVIIKVRELTLGNQERIPKLILIPYISAGISACVAAWFYVNDPLIAFKEASPQIFIYSLGFLFILQRARRKKTAGFSNYTPVTRNLVLIFFVVIVYSLFLLVFGRGLSF